MPKTARSFFFLSQKAKSGVVVSAGTLAFLSLLLLPQVASGRATQRIICQSVIQYSGPLSKTPKDI
jgi:hypothetical protein